MSWRATDLILVLPAKGDVERDQVAAAWLAAGGAIERLDRFWEPPPLDARRVRLYGADAFCLVLAQLYGLELLAPPDDLIADVPAALLQRAVAITTLGAALSGPFPRFVKPLMPKQFAAGVHDRDALARVTAGLPDDTPVIVSEVVTLDAEARSFVLDGRVVTTAIYAGAGDVSAAAALATAIAALPAVPRTCVIDTCLVRERGWAFLEANAAWGAGLNGCDPVAVLPCLAAATIAKAR
ncbi:MAG: ATP-grasp domain-containing protein [Deltaproteobacteria bacterium]|nr:ATP-grasp domain-containing protein [Deltaproteobacteria bacterium]